MFLDTYQSLIGKEMSDSEVMERLSITEKGIEKILNFKDLSRL